MRAVLDTNVLLGALMNPQSPWGELIGRQAEFTQVTSPDILREFFRVLSRPRIHRWIDPAGSSSHVAQALEIIGRAEIVTPEQVDPVSRDPNDDKLFACALAAKADLIVSEDEEILAIDEYEGVRTVRASAFIRILNAERKR